MAYKKVPAGGAPSAQQDRDKVAGTYRPKSRAEIARNMSAIRSRENRTETALRKVLHGMGFRYRKYVAGLPGRPDIVFTRARVAIFIDGDYWHARILQEQGLSALEETLRTESRDYWRAKFQRRVERDKEVTRELREAGWTVLRFWESDTRRSISETAEAIAETVRSCRTGPISAAGE